MSCELCVRLYVIEGTFEKIYTKMICNILRLKYSTTKVSLRGNKYRNEINCK